MMKNTRDTTSTRVRSSLQSLLVFGSRENPGGVFLFFWGHLLKEHAQAGASDPACVRNTVSCFFLLAVPARFDSADYSKLTNFRSFYGSQKIYKKPTNCVPLPHSGCVPFLDGISNLDGSVPLFLWCSFSVPFFFPV